jgi:hypothetical protein
MRIIVLLLLFSMLFANSAFALCVQNNNSLDGLLGLDSTGGNVFAAITSTTEECGCTQVRFKTANGDTKMALSVLLSAKLSGKTVRIDLVESGDCNSAYRVYLH